MQCHRLLLIVLILLTATACTTQYDRDLIKMHQTGKFVGNPRQLKQLLRPKQCRQCDLRGAKLSDQNLAGADLRDADLVG